MAPQITATPVIEITPEFVKRLKRFVGRRVDGRADREDVLQEAVTRVLARVNSGALSEADMEPYAFRVASNLIMDRHRAAKRQFAELPESLSSDDPGPARIAEARAELAAVSDAIDRMPPLRRNVFLLVRVEGLSHKQVAKQLGLSQTAIEKHMTRAIAELVRVRRSLRGQKAESSFGGANV